MVVLQDVFVEGVAGAFTDGHSGGVHVTEVRAGTVGGAEWTDARAERTSQVLRLDRH